MPGVTLDFEEFGTATTALDGTWSKSDLEGRVTITPEKEGWAFSPGSIDVEEASSEILLDAQPVSTVLEIIVKWDELEGSGAEKTPNFLFDEHNDGATDFGSRLEYPDENAFFAQSLSRDEAEEYGVITLDVPPANNTELYVVAVKEDEEATGHRGQKDPVIWIGEVSDLEIEEGTSTSIRMIDVDWTVPLWDFVEDDVREAYEEGTMEGDKDEEYLTFEIFVRDPIGERPSRSIIGLNGTSSSRPYIEEDKRWRIRVHCSNDSIGQEHESTCLFWPFVRPEMFNLPDIRYAIPPKTNEFTIEWR